MKLNLKSQYRKQSYLCLKVLLNETKVIFLYIDNIPSNGNSDHVVQYLQTFKYQFKTLKHKLRALICAQT